MKVEDFMSKEVVTANPRDGLRQTFYRMRERNVHHMPVLDEHERVIGIISDRDLRRPDWVDDEENVAHYYILDNEHKVEQAMAREPLTIHRNDNIKDVVKVFRKLHYGALPVVDDDRRLVGILSVYDLLRAFDEISD